MGTLTALNACLAGFFAFGAIHYAVQWWFSRHERVLLVFAIQCLLCAAFCVEIVSFFRATTIADTQAALDRFVTCGVLVHALVLQLFAHLGNRRDRPLRLGLTAVIVFLALLNQWAPLRGTVIELKAVVLPGGDSALVPIRTPPGASLALLYFAVLAIECYGLFIVRVIWKRDRAGAALVAVGATTMLAGMTIGFLIDFAKVQAPYSGAWPNVIFAVCVALFLSREYSARGARVASSERARQTALEALVQAQRTEIAGQLAAGVAHDFNNVLNVISMWSSVVMNDSATAIDKERARRALTDAQQQGQALSRQLVALARPEARSVTRFPLDRPIHRTVQTLTPALPLGIRLGFEASVAPEVEADETEIQQVIYNLVLNARDAMPDGGSIQITAGLETSPIPIGVVGGSLAAGRWATLKVMDSGPGIDPAIRGRIFDLFFTTKGPERGTGLGLATVQRIAKESGGGVTLETDAGRGAAFKVYLPCV